ncbi:hypothetical protein BB561_004537 [Smittium simulii]|uniref:Uncharacterized protein n=1 Tax=Smittium simulii TaxID=133385 RepID=A0A2T9YFR3_9FUNG|nr:hypothetical protein BB561_004537 [Smittium simulii]
MGRSNLNQKVDAILYDRNIHLAEALQTIEENVFRLSLTDKKRKELIFSCPKSSTMKCLPPSVKDTALATAKRVDSVLYNLQATLVNITRQIYLFVHQKLLNNLEIFPEDNDIVFVHNIRIFEPETGSLFDPKAFKALVTAKNATRKTFLRRHFQRRQQSAHQSYSFNGFAQAQQTQATASTAPIVKADKLPMIPRHCKERIQDTAHKSEFRQDEDFNKDKLYKLQKNMLKQPFPKSLKRYLEKTQNLIITRRTKSEINHSPPLTFNPHYYRRKINKKARDAIKNMSNIYHIKRNIRSFPSPRPASDKSEASLRKNVWEIPRIFTPNQANIKIKMEKSNMTPFQTIIIWDNDKITNYELLSPIRQAEKTTLRNLASFIGKAQEMSESFGIEKQLLEEIKIIGCHNESEQSSNSELRILETYFLQMERFIIAASINSIGPHKRQKIISSLLRSTTLQCCWLLYISIFRQYYNSSIRAEIWGTTSLKLLEVLEKLWLYCIMTNTRSQMAYVSTYISPADAQLRLTALAKLSLSTETFKRLCRIFGSFDVDLFATKQNRKLSKYYTPTIAPVETNPTDPTENSTDKNNNNNANVKGCNLVSDSGENQDIRANTNTGVKNYDRPKKRQTSIT